MKAFISTLGLLLVTVASIAQAHQEDAFSSYDQISNTVRRVTKDGYASGWDDKILNRAGDLAAVAILQNVSDDELAKPERTVLVLSAIHQAFECPARCVKSVPFREPRIAILLLDHLQGIAVPRLRDKIEATKKFVAEQAVAAK